MAGFDWSNKKMKGCNSNESKGNKKWIMERFMNKQ